MMRIGELSKQTSVPTKTIRFYEDIGVLPPAERADNGYRTYGQATVERLDFVKDAQATGLTLEEISTVLRLREQGESTCQHVEHLLDHHLQQLDTRIKALEATRVRLVDFIDRAASLNPSECSDPNRCQTIGPRSHSKGDSLIAPELHGAPGTHDHH
jgi:MerR family copper efflux transcriptional regulator